MIFLNMLLNTNKMKYYYFSLSLYLFPAKNVFAMLRYEKKNKIHLGYIQSEQKFMVKIVKHLRMTHQ